MKNFTKIFSILLIMAISLSATGCRKKAEEQAATGDSSTPSSEITFAVLSTTEGEIKIQLNTEETPVTANNFIKLAQDNFYDDTIFHRVISGFMIQGGDPKGDGTGGPGYKFDDESFTGEYNRGTVAMANSGPNTNGSQFFIMHKAYQLQKDYVIFGQVVEGIETVDEIAEAKVTRNDMGEESQPVKPVKIKSVKIITNK